MSRPRLSLVPTPQPALPTPRQLEALGTVLCLYRPQPGGELAGWTQAVRAEVEAEVESDGLRGRLSFLDRDGACCWRLHLLPDSDFLAWDLLADALPQAAPASGDGLAERLWRRLRLRSERWQGSVLRLHATPGARGAQVMAASLAPVSPLGAVRALRIAHGEHAERPASHDDCCCAQAARAQARASVPFDPSSHVIRLQPREQA